VTFAEREKEKLRLVASKKLQSLADQSKTEGVEISTHLSFGAPSFEIVERAEKTKADLIVMGTRGLGAVKQLFLGSVTARTIQNAPCPVLTVAADD
jgi:nucleotide-binding universal stress UspA family protein